MNYHFTTTKTHITLCGGRVEEIFTDEAIKTYPIGRVINGLPIEFNDVPFDLVMNACLDILGVLDTSHLTLNFIVKMGLYFTQQEMQQPVNKLYGDNKHGLYEKDPETGKAKNRLDVIKRELKLNPAINLRICNTGLNYNEFRSMYYLKRDKYSNLTTDQLKLLSNKVLYRFQELCNTQAICHFFESELLLYFLNFGGVIFVGNGNITLRALHNSLYIISEVII